MPFVTLTCPWCKTAFQSNRNGGKFCSLRCSVDARIEIRQEDECWPWIGGIFQKDGYGRVSFTIDGKERVYNAHHIAYLLHCGPVENGLVVRHSCDNPICCNYKRHLLKGTVKQNSQDAVERGLYPKGETHPLARLTSEHVRIIRSMPFEIITFRDVARLLGCGDTTIADAYKRRTYAHLPR